MTMEVEASLAALSRQVETQMRTWKQTHDAQEMPLLTLTYAQSIDGSIAAKRGVPTILSGPASMRMTHMLRTLHDGILVGVATVAADNPSLNARLIEGGRNPKPIIVDTSLRCPLTIKLFTLSSCEKPILLCATVSDDDLDMQQRRRALEAAGARVIECHSYLDEQSHCRLDLRHAFELLKQTGLESIMIEGGASILTTCLQESAKAHFIDQVIVTIAPTFIGGLNAVTSLVAHDGRHAFPRLQSPSYHVLDQDLVILGHLQ